MLTNRETDEKGISCRTVDLRGIEIIGLRIVQVKKEKMKKGREAAKEECHMIRFHIPRGECGTTSFA